MEVDIAVCSFQGGRDYNEDSVKSAEKDGAYAIVVADGLGSHGGGQIASSVVADQICGIFMETPQIDAEVIRDIFTEVNNAVLEQQTAELKMKSTAVSLFIKDGAAIWAHAGDSRLYHFMDGKLLTQTNDHSVSQMAVFMGEITQDEIRHHEDRNKVLRAFGGNDTISPDVSSPLILDPGFHAFLLCTDGFWEYVLEDEMELDLAEHKKPSEWLDAMCLRLCERAGSNNDNYSAAAVFLRK